MAGSISIQLLGGFFVTIDGVRTGADGFARRGGAELVQLLALTPGRRLHREQVFDALWPEVDPEKAVGMLYRSATAARKVLGSTESISLAGEAVALLPGVDVEIDVDVITEADQGDPDEVAAAIAAYGGELLPGALYAEWTVNRRAQLGQTYLDLLARVGRWRTIVEIEPTHEDAHVALMREALEQGDRQGVLRRFELLEQALLDELGTEPGQAAKELRDAAAVAEPAAGGSVAGLRAVVSARWDDPVAAKGDSGHGRGERTRSLLADVIENAGGSVGPGSGSGLDAVFPSAVAALDSAVACQRVLQGASWEDDGRPVLRIGVDIGEAERAEDGWAGPVLARAAAIGEAAAGDQVVCSTSVIDLAGPLLGELRAVELGLYRLPEMPPVSLHRISAEGMEDRPKPLRAGRLTGRPVSDGNREIFGRDEEVTLVADRLRLHRLVTIVGPGGAGKTHLAEHVATRVRDDYPGGAWMAGLGSIVEAGEVEAEVLAGVGGHRHTDATVAESIVRNIGDQATLIVMDNCEHVIGAVAKLVATMLDRCPNVRILATSREPVGLRDEVLQPIGQLDRGAARALFEAEARRHGFAVEPDDPTLDRICERLDDLPLAIRLAAARTRTLGLADVESLLTDRLDLLRSSDHDQLAHHATLRAAIAWSVDALAPGPREVLIDLSVFADRFTLDGVMAIAARPDRGKGEVLDHFDELVRRSLIAGPIRVDGEARYRLLESVRLFVGELIDDRAAADRHLAFYRDRAERLDRMLRDESNLALDGFRSEWEDLRRARAHAAESGQMEMLTGLLGATAGFAIELLWFEFLDWCEASFSLDDGEILNRPHARAVSAAALMLGYRGESERGRAMAERSLAACDHDDIVLYANGWIQSALQVGDHGRARFEAVLTDPDGTAGPMRCAALCLLSFADETDDLDSQHRIHALSVLAAGGGDIYIAAHRDAAAARLMDRDPEAALAGFEESISLADRIGHRPLSLAGRSGVAYVSTTYGATRDALLACRDSLQWPWDNGLLTSMPFNLARTAKTLERAERPDAATTILATAHGLDAALAAEDDQVGHVDGLRAAHPEQFEAWWTSGAGLDLQAAVALAVSVIDECLMSDGVR